VVPNTDFTAEVSRDGGTTWFVATLVLISTVGNVKTYEDDEVALSGPSGTSMMYRFKTLTNKNIALTGVVQQWR